MKTIRYESLSHGCCIIVSETSDAAYARQCFDGSDREWQDVLADADTPPMFYIVSSGLAGCYMADCVNVYVTKAAALRAAQGEIDRDAEEFEDEGD